jgi:hypothetical protein
MLSVGNSICEAHDLFFLGKPASSRGMVIATSRGSMSETSTPFDSIESAHEYIGLLCEALDEAHRTIGQEIAHPCEFTGARHLDALRLADYKLKSLRQHFVASRRLLTDLRTLRRYLLDERMEERSPGSSVPGQPAGSEAFRGAAR